MMKFVYAALFLLAYLLSPINQAPPVQALTHSVSVRFRVDSDGNVHVYGFMSPSDTDTGYGNGFWLTVNTDQGNGVKWLGSQWIGMSVWGYDMKIPGAEGFTHGDTATVIIYWYDINNNPYVEATNWATYP